MEGSFNAYPSQNYGYSYHSQQQQQPYVPPRAVPLTRHQQQQLQQQAAQPPNPQQQQQLQQQQQQQQRNDPSATSASQNRLSRELNDQFLREQQQQQFRYQQHLQQVGGPGIPSNLPPPTHALPSSHQQLLPQQQQQQFQNQQHFNQYPQQPQQPQQQEHIPREHIPQQQHHNRSSSPMPIVKTKFPVARIKRIMQADEDVGKVAQVTPVIVSKALELFMIALVSKSAEQARIRNSKRITAGHLKQAVVTEEQFDFLADVISKAPDIPQPSENNLGEGVVSHNGGGGGGTIGAGGEDHESEGVKKTRRPRGRKPKNAEENPDDDYM